MIYFILKVINSYIFYYEEYLKFDFADGVWSSNAGITILHIFQTWILGPCRNQSCSCSVYPHAPDGILNKFCLIYTKFIICHIQILFKSCRTNFTQGVRTTWLFVRRAMGFDIVIRNFWSLWIRCTRLFN